MVSPAISISFGKMRKKPWHPPVRGFFYKQKPPMFRVAARLRFIEPQLASPVEQPPEGKHWIHEIKHDGYRSQVLVSPDGESLRRFIEQKVLPCLETRRKELR